MNFGTSAINYMASHRHKDSVPHHAHPPLLREWIRGGLLYEWLSGHEGFTTQCPADESAWRS